VRIEKYKLLLDFDSEMFKECFEIFEKEKFLTEIVKEDLAIALQEFN